MQRPYHVHAVPDPVVHGVGGYWASAGDADLRVAEGLHELLQGFVASEDVVGVEHDDDVAGLAVEVAVDGGVLALPPLLPDEAKVRVRPGEVHDDIVGAVVAAARYHDDLLYGDLRELLRVDGLDRLPDDLRLVVGAYADRNLDVRHMNSFGIL